MGAFGVPAGASSTPACWLTLRLRLASRPSHLLMRVCTDWSWLTAAIRSGEPFGNFTMAMAKALCCAWALAISFWRMLAVAKAPMMPCCWWNLLNARGMALAHCWASTGSVATMEIVITGELPCCVMVGFGQAKPNCVRTMVVTAGECIVYIAVVTCWLTFWGFAFNWNVLWAL